MKEEHKREVQWHYFVEFIRLAVELELPLVIHSREADAIRILIEEHVTRVQLHCLNDLSLVSADFPENLSGSVLHIFL